MPQSAFWLHTHLLTPLGHFWLQHWLFEEQFAPIGSFVLSQQRRLLRHVWPEAQVPQFKVSLQ